MRIALINPPNSGKSIPEEEYGIETIKTIFRGEPLALETLAGNLSEHEVGIIDLKADPESLDSELKKIQPDLVGITGVTCEANAILQIAGYVKENFNSVVAVGGHHASCDPEFFNKKNIDYVIIGLGKSSFREIVRSIENTDNTTDIPGVAKTNPLKPLCYIPRLYSQADLADEKPPRYDLVEKYREKYVMSGVGGKMGFVTTAFGCTHRCSFCSISSITGGKYLTHSIDAILRDIDYFKNKDFLSFKNFGSLDTTMIRLVDANTFGNIKFSDDLAEKIIRSDIKKRFVADVRADTVVKHKNLILKWKEAGLAAVVIGFEDVANERLKGYNKKLTVENHVKALEILKDLKIRVIGDFIVSPDYGYEEFEQLDRFISNHPIDLPIPSILTPIPGTPLYEAMKDKIEIHNLDYYTFSNAVVPTKLDKKEFYTLYAEFFKKFHKHVKSSS